MKPALYCVLEQTVAKMDVLMNVIILVKVISCEPLFFIFIELVGWKIGYRKIKKKRKQKRVKKKKARKV